MLLAAVMLLMGGTATMQAQEWKSFSFAETQVGLQLTSTNAPMSKLLTPRAAFLLGHYFTPVVGTRLHIGASQAKSGFNDLDQYYKWKNITPSLDLMLNVSNLLGYNQHRALNVILLGGVGLSYAWDNDELKALNVTPLRVPLKWDDNRLGHNLRAGLRLETNLSKPFGLSLEVDANSLSDRFNSKTNDADDWQFTAMIGLNYRLGYKGRKRAPVERWEYVTVWQEIPEDIIEYEDIPVEGLSKKQLHKEVFYNICVSDNEDADAAQKEVFQFMNENEKVHVNIVGYADKGTGNERLNMMYSQRRAENFKKDLVEKFGCDPEAISVEWRGDTVQPFEENDKNRCIIIDADGLHRTQKMERQRRKRTVIKKVEKTIRVKVAD